MKKNLVAKICGLMVCVALACVALAGCATTTSTLTEAQQANRNYMSQINQKMEDLGTNLDTFVDAVSRNDVVSMRTEADNAFKIIDEFKNIEAPSDLTDVRNQYVTGVDKLKDALDQYVTLYSEIASSSLPDLSAYSDRIASIQTLYNEGISALEAADKAASSLS